VQLINTDGLVLIGPGSEWFWTAISGIVLAITFIAIYLQLRTARAGEAVRMLQELDDRWSSERMTRHGIVITRWLDAGAPADARPLGSLSFVGNFWERVGTLGRRGHLDVRLLWDAMGSDCETQWILLRDFAHAEREGRNAPAMFENFEWLAGEMIALDRRAGRQPVDPSWVRSSVPVRLAAMEKRVDIEVALRSARPEPAT